MLDKIIPLRFLLPLINLKTKSVDVSLSHEILQSSESVMQNRSQHQRHLHYLEANPAEKFVHRLPFGHILISVALVSNQSHHASSSKQIR